LRVQLKMSRRYLGTVFTAFLLVLILGICFSFDFVNRRIPLCEAPTLAEANIHYYEPLPGKPSLSNEYSAPASSPRLSPEGVESGVQGQTTINLNLNQITSYKVQGPSSQEVIFWNPEGGARDEFSLELGSVFVDSFRLPKPDDDLEEIDMALLSQEYSKYSKGDSCSKEDLLNAIRGQKEQSSFQPSPWPTHGWISSPFGYRTSPFTGRKAFHKGIDIAANFGTPIYVVSSGIVSFSGRRGEYGKLVIIQHAFGFSTLYGHNSINVVKSGDRVECGQLIAYIGNTGRSTASHLHYEIRKDGRCLNPRRYLLAKLF
jgi:murein DD-endopeptidase MepM/ murein hydrolase activator NlpD